MSKKVDKFILSNKYKYPIADEKHKAAILSLNKRIFNIFTFKEQAPSNI
jgi:hypothetical protein